MKHLLLLLSLFAGLSLTAQQWRSDLYPEDWSPPKAEGNNFYTDAFLQDFSYAGYRYGEVEIPLVMDNVVDVTEAPYNADNTGSSDATLAIQAAIDAVQGAGGGVVYLPAGTYNISIQGDENSVLRISESNVVLRGDGQGETFLFNTTTSMRQKEIIRVEAEEGRNWDALPEEGDYVTITADLTGPTKEIPVDIPRFFAVGDAVIVRAEMTNAWVDDHNEGPGWYDFEERLDGMMNYRIVTAVTDSSIIIDIPTRYVYLTRDRAKVYPSRSNMLSEIGLEDFSIGNREIVSADPAEWLEADGTLDNNGYRTEGAPAYDLHASAAIKVERVENGWLRNISSYRHPSNTFGTHILSNGVRLEFCSKLTVDNVYMGYGQFGGGGGNNYGFRIESNDCLIKRCSTELTRHGFVFARIWSSGNVLHQTYHTRTGLCTANETEPIRGASSGSDFHLWFSPSNLIDQMEVDGSYFSAVHRKGISQSNTFPGHNAVTAHSVFWNFTANNSQNGYGIRTSQTRYGYVVGTQGNTPDVNNKTSDLRNLLSPNNSGPSLAFRYDTDGSRTMPFDLVEGVGMAQNLEPQSLYLDQLDRRLNPVSTFNPDLATANISIYPNPSNTGLYNISENVDWSAFDINGRKLSIGRGSVIDLSNQAPGIYLIRFGRRTVRVVNM